MDKRRYLIGFVLNFAMVAFVSLHIFSKPYFTVGPEVYDKEEILEEVLFYSDQLGLDSNVFIRITYSLHLNESVNAVLNYRQIGKFGHQFHITINQRISKASRLLALAHELVHAKQYVVGHLEDVCEGTIRWKRTRPVEVANVAYLDRPWEVEALRLSRKLRKSYMSYVKQRKRKPTPSSSNSSG